MNKQGRKTLDRLHDELSTLKGKFEDIKSELETLRDEEQDKYDNMPESLQSGDRGETLQATIDNLESAINDMESVDYDEVLGYIESAKE